MRLPPIILQGTASASERLQVFSEAALRDVNLAEAVISFDEGSQMLVRCRLWIVDGSGVHEVDGDTTMLFGGTPLFGHAGSADYLVGNDERITVPLDALLPFGKHVAADIDNTDEFPHPFQIQINVTEVQG